MPQPAAPRVALYARSAQANDDAVARQVEEGQKVAAANGWTVVGEFVDNGRSGIEADSPAWAGVLELAEARSIDIVWATTIDRLTRSLALLVQICERLEAADVEIRTGADTTLDALSVPVPASILRSFADHESRAMAERSKAGRRRAADRRAAEQAS